MSDVIYGWHLWKQGIFFTDVDLFAKRVSRVLLWIYNLICHSKKIVLKIIRPMGTKQVTFYCHLLANGLAATESKLWQFFGRKKSVFSRTFFVFATVEVAFSFAFAFACERSADVSDRERIGFLIFPKLRLRRWSRKGNFFPCRENNGKESNIPKVMQTFAFTCSRNKNAFGEQMNLTS